MAKFSELTEITSITDNDLLMVTDAETSASRRCTWSNAKVSINSLSSLTVGALVLTPASSVTPSSNGDLIVEATNDTTITFKLKGSDGTVRTGTITLS